MDVCVVHLCRYDLQDLLQRSSKLYLWPQRIKTLEAGSQQTKSFCKDLRFSNLHKASSRIALQKEQRQSTKYLRLFRGSDFQQSSIFELKRMKLTSGAA